MIKDPNYSAKPGTYNYNTAADGPIREDDLYDATANTIQDGADEATRTAAVNALQAKKGWYIELENSGEKVLAESLTFNNQVSFNTFEPPPVSPTCDTAPPGPSMTALT